MIDHALQYSQNCQRTVGRIDMQKPRKPKGRILIDQQP